MANNTNTPSENNTLRWIVVAGLIMAAFFGAYRFAAARSGGSTTSAVPANAAAVAGSQQTAAQGVSGQGTQAGSGSGSSSNGSGCACCGSGSGAPTANGVTGAPDPGTAQVSGGVQVAAVKVTTIYSPNIIKLKAGIPAEITFGKAAGCTGQVVSQDLGFSEDLTAGPRTVKIASPKKGTYSFSCGMGMVLGQVVVE